MAVNGMADKKMEEQYAEIFTKNTETHIRKRINNCRKYIAEKNDCPLVLGSATPEISTYNKAVNGQIELFEMKNRAADAKLPSIELVKYAYAYDPKDIEYENCLVAYYKLTVNIECTDDQYGFEDDANLMKKGDKDTGVCYIAIKSSAFKVTADNKIEVNISMMSARGLGVNGLLVPNKDTAALEKTLTDNDVEKVMSKLLSTFQNEFGATLR